MCLFTSNFNILSFFPFKFICSIWTFHYKPFSLCSTAAYFTSYDTGFVHSAFTFSHESFVMKANLNSADVPPGALISFVQKGLQYAEIEAHVNEVRFFSFIHIYLL